MCVVLGMELHVGTEAFIRVQFFLHGIARLTQVLEELVQDES